MDVDPRVRDEVFSTLERMRKLLDPTRGNPERWIDFRTEYFELAARMHELESRSTDPPPASTSPSWPVPPAGQLP
jgi:hypothetical protein